MCVDNFEAVLRETEREIGSWNLTKIDELVNFSDEQKLWTELCIKKCPIKVRGRRERERERERQNSQDFNFPISTWKMAGQWKKVKSIYLDSRSNTRTTQTEDVEQTTGFGLERCLVCTTSLGIFSLSCSAQMLYIYISTNMFLVSTFVKYGHLYIGGTKFDKASVI